MYLLEMVMNLLLCGFRLLMFCWTQYHTDLEQMLKKIARLFVKKDTECWKLSCKVGPQPEGGNYRHSQTVIN